jgi:hypothetical protein
VKERQGRKRYEVLLSEQAERSKEKLPPAIQEAIEDKLEWLAKNVHAIRHERLKGCHISACISVNIASLTTLTTRRVKFMSVTWASMTKSIVVLHAVKNPTPRRDC